tara:strand:- start:20919 stop:21143 length:225 start_codon:yes stop_codon:yes gene_type:complete
MQLWLWANVKMGRRGFGFAGNAIWRSEDGETNIVVMKPDMASGTPHEGLSVVRSVSAVWCIPVVSRAIDRFGMC